MLQLSTNQSKVTSPSDSSAETYVVSCYIHNMYQPLHKFEVEHQYEILLKHLPTSQNCNPMFSDFINFRITNMVDKNILKHINAVKLTELFSFSRVN